MSIRYITIDFAGNIYPVERMLNRNGEPTAEPTEVAAAIMQTGPNHWSEIDPDYVPIYTVH